MMVKKKKKKVNKRTFLFTTLSLGIIVISAYAFSSYFVKIYNIYKEKKDLTNKISKLSDEEEKLKSEVKKLKDPEYIARYAREKYLYSKNGEYIIKLP